MSDHDDNLQEWIKDALFDDSEFIELLFKYRNQRTYDMIQDFRSDLTFQLKNIQGTDQWRRQVTALIIRAKARLRQLEGAVNVKKD